MTAEVELEHRQLGKVLPLWHPSPLEESQALTPFLVEIQDLVMEYAKRIVARQQARTLRHSVPRQGPLKLGTGVRQIRTEDRL